MAKRTLTATQIDMLRNAIGEDDFGHPVLDDAELQYVHDLIAGWVLDAAIEALENAPADASRHHRQERKFYADVVRQLKP